MGGGDGDEGDKEKDLEEEKLRQEAIKEAEEKRRIKHKKMEEEREQMRQGIRDKVTTAQSPESTLQVVTVNCQSSSRRQRVVATRVNPAEMREAQLGLISTRVRSVLQQWRPSKGSLASQAPVEIANSSRTASST